MLSRAARKAIAIPDGVTVTQTGQNVTVKGPEGELEYTLHPTLATNIENGVLTVKMIEDGQFKRRSDAKLLNSIPGTARSRLNNMVVGVTEGFQKKLSLVGVGYRAKVQGNVLNLTLGYSHPVAFEIPKGVTITTPSQTEVLVEGNDKQFVMHVASLIREKRPPEPYKGKGVRYADEIIIKKETNK